MNKKENVIKIGFFKKVWYSITNFEKYPAMAVEGLKKAIKYLIALTAIVTVFITLGALIDLKLIVEDFSKYVDENIPEFSYVDGNLNMEMDETILIENVEEIDVDRIVINTLTETDEQKEQIEKDNLKGTTIFFFNNEIVLEAQIEENQIVRQNYTYDDFVTSYTGQYVERFEKADFLKYLTSDKMQTFYLSYGTTMFIYMLMINIIAGLLNALEIAILGLITMTVTRIRTKFVAIYNMAIYSLTLPMILNILYVVVNYFTDFTITYFQIGYIAIAYIYLAATIFILKDDVIKKLQEVEQIKQEQLKVREEIKEQEEKQEENKKEEKNDEGQDVEGSLEDGQG